MSFSDPEKSSIGLMSRKASARPLSRNHWNESRCTEIRSGSGNTSSRLAKEKRSRATGRDSKDYSLEGAGATEARQVAALETRDANRQGTATWHHSSSCANATRPWLSHLGGHLTNKVGQVGPLVKRANRSGQDRAPAWPPGRRSGPLLPTSARRWRRPPPAGPWPSGRPPC